MSDRGTWKIEVGGELLADYGDVVKGEPRTGGKNFMDIAGYGAETMTHVDLGNRHHIFGFTITKTHADNKESVDWYLAGAAAFEGVADVTLTHRAYDGSQAVYLLAAAKVEIAAEEPIGVCSTTKVTITGGITILQP